MNKKFLDVLYEMRSDYISTITESEKAVVPEIQDAGAKRYCDGVRVRMGVVVKETLSDIDQLIEQYLILHQP